MQLLTAARREGKGIIDQDLAFKIADGIVSRRLVKGWSRQAILSSIEGGPSPCGRAFYLMRGGIIVVALFPMTQLDEMNGRAHWHSIRDLFQPLALTPVLNNYVHPSRRQGMDLVQRRT
ncbi:hypothetical protein A7X76_07775 [Stenotrophomonas maltophilia]|uniref:hypothetical protein n=1 Tax=Stenotrophomonas maltophilia TaxID=40324 RepID=UPI000DA75189|nr:hypothetical protein [Stenotrophomonas maltophilia]PZS71975.1 hypothetical protein A7X76_07775 [Stenotrophomonas maltophilia]